MAFWIQRKLWFLDPPPNSEIDLKLGTPCSFDNTTDLHGMCKGPSPALLTEINLENKHFCNNKFKFAKIFINSDTVCTQFL